MGQESQELVNILVVDDQAANLVAFEAFLKIKDYSLQMATSGEAALKLLDQQDFAVILTDVMMPGMDGLAFAVAVKKNQALNAIPIIFLTAKAVDPMDINRGYDAGGVDYLLKPLDTEVVKTKVEIYAELYRQKRLARTLENQLAVCLQRERSSQLALEEHQIASELERAERESRQAEMRLSQQVALARLGRMALLQGSIDELMQEAAKIARTILDVQMSSLFVLREPPAAMIIRDGDSWKDGFSGVSVMSNETNSWIEMVFSAGEPLIFNNMGEQRIALSQELADHDVVSGAGVVIHGEQHPFGALSLFSTTPRVFSRDETAFLQAMGNILGIACERKKSEAAVRDLTRSNTDLEQFSYMASHDLQEPLRKMASFSSLLAQDYKTELAGDGLMYLEQIVDGAKRMRVLIDELLALSTIGTTAISRVPTPLDDCLDAALSDLAEKILESAAVIEKGPMPTLHVDPSEMRRLFQNLLSNAIKYSDKSVPHITVSAEQQEGTWLFCVQDNGIGIPTRHLQQIFVIFKRLHGRGKYPGTGIGLATCKKIVERHGGEIWAERLEEGGTAFYFTLADNL